MEKRYKSLSLFEFQEKFPDDDSCLRYLAELKWNNGFCCVKCKRTNSCKSSRPHARKCTFCKHIESPTAGTLFHKVKFSLRKAFYIVYLVSTTKGGIASTELSRKLELRQKTCWAFKQKVMQAMESSEKFPLDGFVEVDETYVGGQDPNSKGRRGGKKKLVVFGIEKRKGGIARAYGKVIHDASAKSLGSFFQKHIGTEAAVTTDKWRGYSPLRDEYPNLTQEVSDPKNNFKLMHRFIMGFKSWLRGTHHSVNKLQSYLNEYTYRFNRHSMHGEIFDNLLLRMVKHPPVSFAVIRGQ